VCPVLAEELSRGPRMLAVLACVIPALSLVMIAIGPDLHQRDLRVFHACSAALEGGINPYDKVEAASIGIPPAVSYLYPPLVLHAFRPLHALDYQTAYLAWLAVKLLALALLLRLWSRHFETLPFSWPIVLFMALGFNAAILRDLATGNMAVLEQLGLWTGFYFLVRNRPFAAGAIIALTAQFKLMPVVFLALLLVIGPAPRWKPFAASLGLFFGLLALNALVMPEMTDHYVASFASANPNLDERGEIHPSSLAMIRDVFAFAGSRGVALPTSLPVLVYLTYVAVLGSALLWALWRYRRELAEQDPRPLIYLACIVYMLTMPRVKDYTYIILLIPALFVFRQIRPGPFVPLLGVLVFMPPAMTYVPALGRHAIAWAHSYLPWLIAAAMFGIMVRWLYAAMSAPSVKPFIAMERLASHRSLDG
jgi:Glycosyltransferase family 87